MKREIRFRGLNSINKQWIYGAFAEDAKGNYVILPKENWAKGGVVDKESVGQMSEFKDANNLEIFEHDIVKAPYLDHIFGDVIENTFVNAVISFRDGSFVVDYGKEDRKVYLSDLHDKLNVIGNIFNNPNLIK